jgi:hypothetical protein
MEKNTEEAFPFISNMTSSARHQPVPKVRAACFISAHAPYSKATIGNNGVRFPTGADTSTGPN